MMTFIRERWWIHLKSVRGAVGQALIRNRYHCRSYADADLWRRIYPAINDKEDSGVTLCKSFFSHLEVISETFA